MYDEKPEELASDEVEIEAIGIEISSQPIELYKIFKIANVVNGGGEAKHIISEGYVAVNGEIETRKRRKMYDGDLVEFNQEYYVVLCGLPEGEPPEVFEEAASIEKSEFDQPIEYSDDFFEETHKTVEQTDVEEEKPASVQGRKSIKLF